MVHGILGPGPSAESTEHQTLSQRIGTQAIGPTEGNAGYLSRSQQTRNRGIPVDVRTHSSHHVVNDGPDRDGLVDGVNADVFDHQLSHKRELFIDYFLSQMAQIQMNVPTVFSLKGTAFVHLGHNGPRQDVPRSQLHLAGNVTLQKTLTLFIDEVSSLSPGGLGDQNAGSRQSGRMVLDKLHVLERSTSPVGQSHAIA